MATEGNTSDYGLLELLNAEGSNNKIYPLKLGSYAIGSSINAEIRLPCSKKIQDLHCIVHVHPNKLATVTPESLFYPTKLNNKILRKIKYVVLKPGDILDIGDIKILYKNDNLSEEDIRMKNVFTKPRFLLHTPRRRGSIAMTPTPKMTPVTTKFVTTLRKRSSSVADFNNWSCAVLENKARPSTSSIKDGPKTADESVTSSQLPVEDAKKSTPTKNSVNNVELSSIRTVSTTKKTRTLTKCKSLMDLQTTSLSKAIGSKSLLHERNNASRTPTTILKSTRKSIFGSTRFLLDLANNFENCTPRSLIPFSDSQVQVTKSSLSLDHIEFDKSENASKRLENTSEVDLVSTSFAGSEEEPTSESNVNVCEINEEEKQLQVSSSSEHEKFKKKRSTIMMKEVTGDANSELPSRRSRRMLRVSSTNTLARNSSKVQELLQSNSKSKTSEKKLSTTVTKADISGVNSRARRFRRSASLTAKMENYVGFEQRQSTSPVLHSPYTSRINKGFEKKASVSTVFEPISPSVSPKLRKSARKPSVTPKMERYLAESGKSKNSSVRSSVSTNLLTTEGIENTVSEEESCEDISSETRELSRIEVNDSDTSTDSFVHTSSYVETTGSSSFFYQNSPCPVSSTSLKSDFDLSGIEKLKATPNKAALFRNASPNESSGISVITEGDDTLTQNVSVENFSDINILQSKNTSTESNMSALVLSSDDSSVIQDIDDSGDTSNDLNESKPKSVRKTLNAEVSPVVEIEKLPDNILSDVGGIKKLVKFVKAQNSPRNDLSNPYGIKRIMASPRTLKSPENDLSDVRGVKKLLKTPKAQKGPKNDLSNPYGVKRIMASPRTLKSPENDLSDVRGVKKLLKTPKAQKAPKNDLSSPYGVKQLMASPRTQKSPENDLSDVRGVKRLFTTPKIQKSPENDLRTPYGVKQMMTTPKIQKSPENNLSDVRGVKKLLKTPKAQKSPKNDLSSPYGVKQLMMLHKTQRSPANDLSDVKGVKRLLKTPKIQKSPENDLSSPYGVKQVMATPKVQKPPENNLSDVTGVKRLMKTPVDVGERSRKVQKNPKNDYTDVGGVKRMFAEQEAAYRNDWSMNISGVANIFDSSSSSQAFDTLLNKKPIRTYQGKSSSPTKLNRLAGAPKSASPVVPIHVANWVNQQNFNIVDDSSSNKDDLDSPKTPVLVKRSRGVPTPDNIPSKRALRSKKLTNKVEDSSENEETLSSTTRTTEEQHSSDLNKQNKKNVVVSLRTRKRKSKGESDIDENQLPKAKAARHVLKEANPVNSPKKAPENVVSSNESNKENDMTTELSSDKSEMQVKKVKFLLEEEVVVRRSKRTPRKPLKIAEDFEENVPKRGLRKRAVKTTDSNSNETVAGEQPVADEKKKPKRQQQARETKQVDTLIKNDSTAEKNEEVKPATKSRTRKQKECPSENDEVEVIKPELQNLELVPKRSGRKRNEKVVDKEEEEEEKSSTKSTKRCREKLDVDDKPLPKKRGRPPKQSAVEEETIEIEEVPVRRTTRRGATKPKTFIEEEKESVTSAESQRTTRHKTQKENRDTGVPLRKSTRTRR